MSRRWVASRRSTNCCTPSSTTTDAEACRSASPVDIDAESAPAQKSPTTSGGIPVSRIMNGRMKSSDGGVPAKRTPENPIRKIGIRKSWKVGKRITVRRSVSSSFAVKAFMKRCGHIMRPMALTSTKVV